MSYVTNWSGELAEGIWEANFPSNIVDGPDTKNFYQWEDGSTNPRRTFNVTGPFALHATYIVQALTALEVHAFKGTEEVVADGLIVETGETFQTPATLEVAPGSYIIRLIYEGITKDYFAEVQENTTIRVDGDFTTPISPFDLLIRGVVSAATGVGLILLSM